MRNDPGCGAIVIMRRSLKRHGIAQVVTEPFARSSRAKGETRGLRAGRAHFQSRPRAQPG